MIAIVVVVIALTYILIQSMFVDRDDTKQVQNTTVLFANTSLCKGEAMLK